MMRRTILSVAWIPFASSQTDVYTDCNTATYYASFDTQDVGLWSRADLSSLLQSTHRGFLPYTDNDSKVDVWRALIDLDGSNGNVHLIYRDVDFPATPFGTPDTWNREHVWPKSRGVETEGRDFTDVHHLRPSDWNVNAARSNKNFGNCNGSCTTPATAEAAADTASNSTTWLPPASVRGDIARMVMYMDVRYTGKGTNELDLVLTNCPSGPNQLGYLNDLLEWHAQDPPDDNERNRNDKACSQWQGNRNPFVDFPELANTLFVDDPGCSPSTAPIESIPSTCVGTGGIMITGVNADNPDVIEMVALESIPAGSTVFMTDNAWTGSEFRSNEGTEQLTFPEDVRAGTVFGYGSANMKYNNLWNPDSGSLELSTAGDAIFVYCEDDKGAIFPISAISTSGTWLEAGLSEGTYGTQKSALPKELEGASVPLSHKDNYRYIGTTTGSKSELQQAISTASNWEGSNFVRFSFPNQQSFRVTSGSSVRFIGWFGLFLSCAGLLFWS